MTSECHLEGPFFFVILGTEPRASFMLGKHSTTQLSPQHQGDFETKDNEVVQLEFSHLEKKHFG